VDQTVPLSDVVLPVVAPAYRLFCSGSKLPMKDLTLKSGMFPLVSMFVFNCVADPFFEISVASSTSTSKSTKIYRSEVIKQTLTPEWLAVDVSRLQLYYHQCFDLLSS
jgi:hypothetical protein